MSLKLEMYRGNDRLVVATATYPQAVPEEDIEAGEAYSLTGKTLWFTVKLNTSDSDRDALFQKTSGSGITVRDAPDDNVAEITIDRADTLRLAGKTSFVYDFQSEDEDGKVYTLAEGVFSILATVTHTA